MPKLKTPNSLTDLICRRHFDAFCEHVLGQKLGKMHEEWINEVMSGSKNINLRAARGHFKTTIMSISFPLWIMYRHSSKERKTFLICSGSLKQSTEIIDLIKEKISENPILREELYPDNIHETKWSETQIKVKKGHRVICVPFGDGARGFHSDYTICDDVLTDQTSDIDYAKKTYYSVVFPTTQAKRGKQIVVGTPISFRDLLSDLEDKETFKSMKYPSVIIGSDGKWERPMFPEHFSLEQLMDIKKTQPANLWSREYMCSPVSDASALFPYETHIFPCIELGKELEKKRMEERVTGKLVPREKFLGVDIAMTDNPDSDFTVLTEIESTPGEPFYVGTITRHRGFSISEIERLHQQNGYTQILVEKTGLGQGPVEALTQSDITKSAVIDFNTTQKSKELILSRLCVLMANKQIALPNNDTLIQELMQMGVRVVKGKETYDTLGKHNDMVMSLALAAHAADQFNDVVSIAFV